MPNKKGFTLLEIIVVSLIVGVLVLIAIPNFTNMLNRSYARQALTNLLAIYSAQQSYYMNNNSAYCGSDCDATAKIKAQLGVDLTAPTPVGTVNYSCKSNGLCFAAGVSIGLSSMGISLASPITTSTPVYCGVGFTASSGGLNPCCWSNNGHLRNTTCP